MTDFGMGLIHTAVKPSIENDSTADAGPDGDIDQARLVLARSPAGFCKGSSIGVVFHGDRDVENLRQSLDDVSALPAWKKVDVANHSGEGIDRTGGPNPDSGNLDAGLPGTVAQHIACAFERVGKSARRLGGRFKANLDAPLIIYQADGDLGPANVDSADHSVHFTRAPS